MTYSLGPLARPSIHGPLTSPKAPLAVSYLTVLTMCAAATSARPVRVSPHAIQM